MLAIDVINSFRKILSDKEGDFDVPKETILKILESYEEDLSEDRLGSDGELARIEHYYIGQRDSFARSHETSLEQYKIVNAAGQSAMRSLFLMNGGASIAMAAFIGALAGSSQMETKVSEMATPLGLFAFGTLAASIAFGCTYLSHFIADYDQAPKLKVVMAEIINYSAILSSIGSMVLFGLGLFYGHQVMK